MEDSLKSFQQPEQQQQQVSVSSSKFIGKVFLYTSIGLLITALVAAIIGFVFSSAIQPVDYNYTEFVIDTEKFAPYIYLLIGAAIAYIPILIWIYFGAFRGHGRLDVPFVIYAIIMGVLISAFTMFVPIQVIAISFGITCVVFGLLALIGLTSKKNLSFLGLVAMGLFFGAMLVALFNIIWSLVFPSSFQSLYWVVSFAIFLAMMLITIFDVWRVKKIAQKGENSNNVALFCAFNLYVDFIYLFIRILGIVASIYGRSR